MTKDNQVGQSFEASHSIRLPVSLSLPKRSMPLHAGVSDWEEFASIINATKQSRYWWRVITQISSVARHW
jgi:hypothetical protein